MHTESAAAMHLMQTESCSNERASTIRHSEKISIGQISGTKSAITAMLAAGDIMNEVASQLMDKLNTELLDSHLI
jgi:hypothetical protein